MFSKLVVVYQIKGFDTNWLTFFSADTHAIVEDQVLMGQLSHHAGSFKERLQDERKQNKKKIK